MKPTLGRIVHYRGKPLALLVALGVYSVPNKPDEVAARRHLP